jgi:hypothetical protein
MTHLIKRTVSKLAGGALILTAFLALAACGASASTGSAPTTPPTVTPAPTQVPPTATPNPKLAIEQTIASFCNAVHDGNYDAAFALFSPQYQRSVGSPSQVPYIPGLGEKLLDCMEFGNGNLIQGSGSRVTDPLSTTLYVPQLGTQESGAGNATLVLQGSRWLIDAITA